MIYLLLSIACNTLIVLIFKYFDKKSINTFQAIVINYFVAASVGILNNSAPVKPADIIHQNWLYIALALGVLFITIFYMIALTTQKISVSTAAVANKMSVIIPVSAAIYFYHNKLDAIKIIGIILALAAVYLTTVRKEQRSASDTLKLLLLPLVVFFGSGAIDTLINYAQHFYLEGIYSSIFLFIVFIFAGIIGLVVVIIQAISNKKLTVPVKNIAGGTVLGVINFGSMFFVIKTLDTKIFQASIFYPINNIGIVGASAIGAYLIFKEKLSKTNMVGILIAIMAIILMIRK